MQLWHLETLDNGLTTVKLIGKLLREKITIEGLFGLVLMVVLKELVHMSKNFQLLTMIYQY